jgi:MFS family permease
MKPEREALRGLSMPQTRTAQSPGRALGRWWIVVAMIVAMSVSNGAITHYTLGILLSTIVSDLHGTRGGVSLAMSLHLIGMGISVPVFGAMIDRFGARLSAVISITLFALGLAATATAVSGAAFLILLPLAGLVAGGTNVTPYVVTIATRFDSNRGLALGIGAAGVGLGGIYLPRLVQYVSATEGWRVSLFTLALLVLVVAMPGALLALNRRAAYGLTSVPPWKSILHTARGNRNFKLISVAILCVSIPVGGVLVHASALLVDRGASHQSAAGTVSFMGVASVLGRITGGYLMDRFHAPRISGAFFSLAGIGLILLVLPGRAEWSSLGLLCLGLTAGAEADAIAYLSIRYMRLPGLGGVSSLLITVYTIASAIGISLLGYIFDWFGSYTVGLSLGAVLALTAAVLIQRLGPYPELTAETSPRVKDH